MFNQPNWIKRKYDYKYRQSLNELIQKLLLLRDYKGIDNIDQFITVTEEGISKLIELKRALIFFKNNSGELPK